MSSAVVVGALNDQGDGMAMVDGRAVPLPFTAPGDRVRFTDEGPQIEPFPGAHADPPCPLFGRCGGCRVQHLSDPVYATWKAARVSKAFERAGLSLPPPPMVRSPFAGRRRLTFTRAGKRTGYFARSSNEVVDVGDCPALAPELRSALPDIRKVAARYDHARLTATLCDNGIDVSVTASKSTSSKGGKGGRRRGPRHKRHNPPILPEAGPKLIRIVEDGDVALMREPPQVRFAGVPVTVPPGAFLQATREGEQALIAAVSEGTAGAKTVLDAFCGVGTFSFPLARNASVFAVDGNRAAVDALGHAARAVERVKPIRTAVRDLMRDPLSAGELERFDTVVFDPPRAGAEALSEALARSRVQRVVAVSCEPRTLARDCAALVAGGFNITHAVAVDQFVATAHIEAVVILEKCSP